MLSGMRESYIDLLKKNNLSVTSVRLNVLDALDKYPHAEADEIYNTVKTNIASASKQAIYNNLHALVDCGIVREIKPKGRPSLFETRVGDNHHHIICRSCDAIMDTDCHGAAPCLEPDHSHGFKIDEAEVVFWGLCPKCQKSKK